MRGLMVIFMVGLICTGLISASFCAEVNTDKSMDHAQVVVVGAGMAGLMSSITLAERGIEVILLEKEDIVGGKMYSPVLDGINCNLGTQYLFRGIHPVVDNYVKSLKIQPIEIGGYMWKGKFERVSKKMEDIFPAPDELENDLTLAFEQLNIDRQLAAKGKEFFFDVEPENDLWAALENINSYEYLSKFPEGVYDFINAETGVEAGGTLKNLSAIVLVGWDGDENQGKFLVKGGNQVFAEKITDGFVDAGGCLYLNSEVKKITQSVESVKIECDDGRIFTSDYVVVATPADVTRDIVSNLTVEKIRALEAVGYSKILELGLHLKNFPDNKGLGAVLFVGECINGLINQTGPIIGKPDRGTIVSICITDPETMKLNDKEVIARSAGVLKKISPEFDPESDILSYLIKRWEKGVYSWPAGFAARHQNMLRKPVGRIYFAGDYTGDPTLMGAAWSGIRAAEKISNVIKGINIKNH